MSEEQFSKTVRIDLMPDAKIGAGTGRSSGDRLAGANWSTRQRQTAAAAAATRSKYEDLLQSVYDAAFITTVINDAKIRDKIIVIGIGLFIILRNTGTTILKPIKANITQ